MAAISLFSPDASGSSGSYGEEERLRRLRAEVEEIEREGYIGVAASHALTARLKKELATDLGRADVIS